MVQEEKELKEFCTFKPKISPMRSSKVSAKNSKIIKSFAGNKPPKQKRKKSLKKNTISPQNANTPRKVVSPRTTVSSTNKINEPKNFKRYS